MRSSPDHLKHSMNWAAKNASTMIGAIAAIDFTSSFAAASLSFSDLAQSTMP